MIDGDSGGGDGDDMVVGGVPRVSVRPDIGLSSRSILLSISRYIMSSSSSSPPWSDHPMIKRFSLIGGGRTKIKVSESTGPRNTRTITYKNIPGIPPDLNIYTRIHEFYHIGSKYITEQERFFRALSRCYDKKGRDILKEIKEGWYKLMVYEKELFKFKSIHSESVHLMNLYEQWTKEDKRFLVDSFEKYLRDNTDLEDMWRVQFEQSVPDIITGDTRVAKITDLWIKKAHDLWQNELSMQVEDQHIPSSLLNGEEDDNEEGGGGRGSDISISEDEMEDPKDWTPRECVRKVGG
jgi:hypothetical protein